ncbi:MAG: polysaccharide deacetylase family protein [Cyclobacteriaceae bacterium]|nr:polysaccharide deacetylase family protein [Cyclobacteriaceae bacterium]
MAPDTFSTILRGLIKHYHIYPLRELNHISDPKACYITFDDATIDFYQYAWPILKQYHIPVTLFVPTHSVNEGEPIWNYKLFSLLLQTKSKSITLNEQLFRIDPANILSSSLRIISYFNENPLAKKAAMDDLLRQFSSLGSATVFRPMNWSQLKEVMEAGVEIGSHGHNHVWMETLNEKELMVEFVESKRYITANLGIDPQWFAFPMGAAGTDAIRIGKELYQRFFLANGTMNQKGKNIVLDRVNQIDHDFHETYHRINGVHGFVSSFKFK